MKTTPDRRQYRVHCPHCRAPAIVRSSVAITDEVRQLYLACSQKACGHIFAATAEVRITISHTIAPSFMPSAEVTLPVTAPAMRRHLAPRPARRGIAIVAATQLVPANDRGPEVPPANENDALGEAVII